MSSSPPTQARSLKRTRELLARAQKLIPGASQTLSKNPTQWVQGVAPSFIERGSGAYVWDVDGNRYLDLPMALGPILLGHCHPAVDQAIVDQLRSGITFTLPHPLEIEVAERVASMVPGAERVRFAKSGSDVTSAAVRLARAHTGRDRVIVAGYHGWHDWFIGSTSRRRGVPGVVSELVRAVPFGEVDSLREALETHPGEVAAVVLEPVGALELDGAQLQGIVDLVHQHGALAVFDEVITGFRLASGGAQEHYGVRADLACFGKALGNGMPISALTGPAELMDGLNDVFFSGTHGGETLSLAAARATLDVISSEPVHEHLWKLGERLQLGVQAAIRDHGLEQWLNASGAFPWTIVAVTEPDSSDGLLRAKSLLQQELLKRGVLFNGSNFISYAHSPEDIDLVIDAYSDSFAILAAALPDGVEERLEGPPVSAAFRTPS